MGPKTSAQTKSKGKVVIFYKTALYSDSLKALINLLPFLKSHGFTAQCFHAPSGYTREQALDSATQKNS